MRAGRRTFKRRRPATAAGRGYPDRRARDNLQVVNHWAFVLAAYALTAAVLLGYWWRVERRIRVLEERARGSDTPPSKVGW